MSQEWASGRERSNVFAMRLLVWVALRLGRPLGRALLYPICAYYVVFSRRSRSASRKYLARVLNRAPSVGDLFRHYFCFAAVALDRMFLLRDRFEPFDISVRGEDILLDALRRGEPCFLLGAHLGSFEVLRALGREKQIRVGLVMFESASPNFNAIARAVNPELESAVVRLGTADSMIRLSERMKRGEWVGMLGDRALYPTGRVRVSFLGEEASLPTAPYRLAAMLGRPIVLMVGLYRGGNRYELCFERLVDAPRLERATRERVMQGWAQQYASRLEHYCRAEPYNWFNFYDFWAGATTP